MAKADPHAVIIELLRKDNLEGHTYSMLHSVAQTARQQTGLTYEAVIQFMNDKMTGSVVIEGKRVMLAELYDAELTIALCVEALLQKFN